MEGDNALLGDISSKFTEETLKSILIEVTEKQSVKVLGWEFEPASGKGDNYLSIVRRVTINGIVDNENTQIKVVIKALPRNEATKKTLRSVEFFENEINFYGKIIPALEKFLESKKQKGLLAVPKCLKYHCDGNNDFIVLQDVGALGYRHIPRKDIWRIEECQVVLKYLARFHAASFAYKNQYPAEFLKIVEHLSVTYFSKNLWDWQGKLFSNSVVVAKDAMSREYNGTAEAKKFTSLSAKELFDKTFVRMTELSSSSIITQGDSWPTNFMLRTNETTGEQEAILLDFQLARPGSPVTDISNFIYTSTDKEMRDNYFDDLLKCYYNELSETINLLGSDSLKIYSWDFFMKEVKEQFIVGFCFSLEGLPMLMLEESEVIDTENIQGTEGVNVAEVITVKPIESKEKRRRLADMIVHAIQLEFI